MDTLQLKAFLSVAECESFTLAAEQLHITQPAVSKRISSLEEQLSCRLFDRVGRRIILTEAGRSLLPRARKILAQMVDTERAISNLSGDVDGALKLATSHHIGLHHLPQILQRFTQNYPGVDLELSFLDSEGAYAAIESGAVELALITLSDTQPGDVSAQVLWPDELAFVAAVDHPLVSQTQLDLSDLAQHPAILPTTTTQTTQLIQRQFDRHGFNLNISMATNYLETIKMMVSIGLGWSVLPKTMIDGTLATIDPGIGALQRQLGYIHHRQRTLSNAAGAMIDELNQS